MLEAKLKVEKEFETYRVMQDRDYESDFDKAVKRIRSTENEKEGMNYKIHREPEVHKGGYV